MCSAPEIQSEHACRSGQDSPIPSAPPSTGSAPTSRSFPRSPSGSSCACSTTTGARRGSICRKSRRSAGTATCRTSSPASATAFACTARGSRSRGIWCNPNKLLLDPYAKAIDGSGSGTRRSSRITSTNPRTRRTTRTARRSAEVGGRQPVLRLGARSPPEHAVARDRRLRDARQGFTKRHPDIPEELRGTYAGLAHPAAIEVPAAARHHRGRAAAGPPVRPGLVCSSAGCATTGATTRSATSRRTTNTRCGQTRRAGAGVQAPGEDAARGRHRGHPRRGLQPHRRRQPSRPGAVVQGHRQRRLLPADRRTTAATTWTTPAPATR